VRARGSQVAATPGAAAAGEPVSPVGSREARVLSSTRAATVEALVSTPLPLGIRSRDLDATMQMRLSSGSGRDRGAPAALRGLRCPLPRVALCAMRTSRFRSSDRAINDYPRGWSRLSPGAATTQSRRRALSKCTASPAAMPGTLTSAPTLVVGECLGRAPCPCSL